MNSLWIKNGFVVSGNKKPKLCGRCPCGTVSTCFSYAHYATCTATAWQRLNRLTMEVNGHSFDMALVYTSFSRSVQSTYVDIITGIAGFFTGYGYSSTFTAQNARLIFNVFESASSASSGASSGFQGRYYNTLGIEGFADIDGVRYSMEGYWRNLTDSEAGSVVQGVPLDLSVSVGDGRNTAPSSMNLPQQILAWQTEARGAWTIGPARYDSTVQCDMVSN